MSEEALLYVAASERGVLRLFTLDMPPEEVRFLRETPGAVSQALGVSEAREDLIEIFDTKDLGQIGLRGYLTEGCGIDPALLDQDPQLDQLTGWLLALPSQAVTQRPVTLSPQSKIRFVARFGEPPVDWSAKPMAPPAAALPEMRRPSPRAARARARTIGGVIFAVVMMCLVGLVWALLG